MAAAQNTLQSLLVPERLKILQSLMPEVFDEGRIDWEKLRATLGAQVNFSNERYVLNWAGKSDAFHIMQQSSTATLTPCHEESVDFDTTQNIFIEGENMEVLKVLQKSYFGRVKMIYIDPPYNTGNDSFIYPDKFSESKEDYLRRVGDKDDDGYMTREGLFRKNSRENGQYHSNWLSMMMPRLYLAKSLLREDGVIFISIDDNEVHNLRLLMNEIFGEENFVAQLIWEQGRKSMAAQVAINHEYCLIYCKNRVENIAHDNLVPNTNWRMLKQGLNKIYTELDRLIALYGKNNVAQIEQGLSAFYKSLPDGDPAKEQSHYKKFDPCLGIYHPDNISQGTGKGGRFDIIHPLTGRPCKCPTGGWRFSKDKLPELLAQHRIAFGPDETTIPCLKRFLKETEYEVFASVFYRDGRGASKRLDALMGGTMFDYPKDEEVIKNFISLTTSYHNSNDIILDFFAGSGTTAQAVMQLNKEDGGNRKYICVQLPELCEENSEAYKAGYRTITDISKERIRRAGAKICAEIEAEQAKQQGQLSFDNEQQAIRMPDLGFKVFKLSDSNFKVWRNIKGSDTEQWHEQTLDFLNPVAPNASIPNMVYELLLRCGKDLNSTVLHRNGYYVISPTIANAETATATKDITPKAPATDLATKGAPTGADLVFMLESANQSVVDAVLAEHPQKVIALDNLFENNDQLKTNTTLQFRDANINFKTI